MGVPGNVPYVITVGAMTDNYTASTSDDRLASFSSTGPTFEGFVKPDLVAPGGHQWGFMGTYMKIAVDHPTYMNNGDFFTMSGTSAGRGRGVGCRRAGDRAEPRPHARPGEVPHHRQRQTRASTARASSPTACCSRAPVSSTRKRAVFGSTNNCANQGLNINADLAGTQHFMGGVRQLADGTFQVSTPSGPLKEQGYLWSNGYLWANGYLWSNGYLWANGYLWVERLPLARGL